MHADSDVEHVILGLEDVRYAALVRADYDAFADLCHPDLLYTHATSVVDTLDSFLEKCRSGWYDYHRLDHPVTRITVLPDVVLVFGQMIGEVTAGGTRKQLHSRTLAVWSRHQERWKLLATQSTGLPDVSPVPRPLARVGSQEDGALLRQEGRTA
ncbi:nuclear transport factor 2 family protein [Kineococcus sp. SYSU DK003]|uniref:nuclear transport factor 2 family protein n=1 Tax=Kineococcus sp. SYSU DK003 TaxID=3383124 RepID=UPI003D7D799D